jgi:ribonuclease T2
MLNGKLAFKGNTIFYADKAPKGPVKSKVFASTADHPIKLEILWEDIASS